MNSHLADMLNESSITEMQISVQRVHLTLSGLESVDANADRSALCEIRTACKSVAAIVNDLLADDVNSSSSDSEDVCYLSCTQCQIDNVFFRVSREKLLPIGSLA